MLSIMMFFLATLSNFILATKYSNNLIELNFQPRNRYLNQCLLKTVSSSAKTEDSIAIINGDLIESSIWDELVKGSSLQENWTFIQCTFTNVEENNIFNKIDKNMLMNLFLIQISSTNELKTIIEHLQGSNLFNPSVNFLIASTTKFQNTTRAVSSIFENLWHANIYNSLVVLPAEIETKVNIFTWYPYGNKSSVKDFTKYEIIDVCYKGELRKKKSLYRSRIPDDLKGYAVKVRTVVWPPFVMEPAKRINNSDRYVFRKGFEIVLMNTLAQSMNLNITYTLSEKHINWGDIYENGTATGMQAFLLQNEGDIGISSQGYSQSKLKYFDMAIPYFFEHLVWCVPSANTVPPLTKLVVVFSLNTWMLSIVSFAIFTLLFWRLSSYSLADCVQNTFGMLLGIPILPIPKRYIVKLLLSFWFVFTIHMNMIYKTSLISLLTSPVNEKQIKTLDDILKTDLRLQFMPTMKRSFNENKNKSEMILERWIDCIDLNDCMDRVAYTRDSVMLLPKLYLEFVVAKYKKKHGSYIYCFNGNIMTFPGSMVMRKGFPLKSRINSLIGRLISAGLVDRWQKDALSINLSSNKTMKLEQEGEKKIITFNELKTAFVCLGFGLILSTVVFVIEVYCAKYNRRWYIVAYRN